MASGLQCPGCGHVHPAGLPEIVRGDATFRCYGCYRTLSIPEGWTGRPTPRPVAPPVPTADAPPGAGLRDARASRLAGRRGVRPADRFDEATQMVPLTGAAPEADWPASGADWPSGAAGAPAPNWPAAGATGGWAGAAGAAAPGSAGVAGARTATGGITAGPAGTRGATAGSAAGPLGWVTPRRSRRAVGAPVRALVWVGALAAGLFVSAFLLKALNVLGVNTAIELFAGTGPRRFGILLVMLPLWALLSATIAHLSL